MLQWAEQGTVGVEGSICRSVPLQCLNFKIVEVHTWILIVEAFQVLTSYRRCDQSVNLRVSQLIRDFCVLPFIPDPESIKRQRRSCAE